jgi:hypothetical protein
MPWEKGGPALCALGARSRERDPLERKGGPLHFPSAQRREASPPGGVGARNATVIGTNESQESRGGRKTSSSRLTTHAVIGAVVLSATAAVPPCWLASSAAFQYEKSLKCTELSRSLWVGFFGVLIFLIISLQNLQM